MIKKLVMSTAVACLAAVAVLPSASAASSRAEATPRQHYAVELSARPAALNGDGSVSVVGWLRCAPDLYSFEYSVGVRQKKAFGSAFESQRAVLPCDGTRHRFVINASPDEGRFRPGPAEIGIYIGLYNAANDADLAIEDAVSTRLYRR